MTGTKRFPIYWQPKENRAWTHWETQGFSQVLRINFTTRLTVENFPSAYSLSYLRKQLKEFMGGVCFRSKIFFFLGAVFSNNLFRLKQTALWRITTQREFVQLTSSLDSRIWENADNTFLSLLVSWNRGKLNWRKAKFALCDQGARQFNQNELYTLKASSVS